MAGLVRREAEGCGVQFVDARTFTYGNAFMGNPGGSDAVTNMGAFKNEGITTIIWAGGYEPYQSAAAANLNYYPEWIVMGADHVMDEEENTSLQNQQVWSHAVVVTSDIAADPHMAEPSSNT